MTGTLRKFALAALSTEGLADKRQVAVNVSADGLDRQGDIVVQSGIDTRNFMKTGGTVLWNHDPDTPIARAVSIGVDGGQMRSLVQFPDAGVSPKADEIYGLVKAGIVNSTSIGFSPVKWEPIDPKEPWSGRRYDEIELLEFSFVSVPAQPDATVVARSAATKADAAWKVGASLNLPIGEDGAWDGPAAEASIFEHAGFDGPSTGSGQADPDTSFARKGFLAYDSAAPKLRGSYKLPFARVVDGRLTAMPAGIRAAASRLPDTDIPEAAKAKAKAAIDHYEAKMQDGKALTWEAIEKAFHKRADPASIALIKALFEAYKGGRVLSAENMKHVEGLMKCLSGMTDCHAKACGGLDEMGGHVAKALDSRGFTHDQLEAFRDHLNTADAHVKCLMKAARKPKPKPDDEDPDPSVDPDDDYTDPADDNSDVELAARAALRKRMIEIAARQ